MNCHHLSIIVFTYFHIISWILIITTAKLIPRKVIFSPPDYSSLALSPDGRWMSWIAYNNNTPNIWIRQLHSGEPLQLTNEIGRGVFTYTWIMDNQTIVYSQDKDGDENWRLYSTSIHSRSSRLLTDTSGVSAVILKKSIKFPSLIMIGLNNRDSRYHDVYEVDVTTGKMKQIFLNDRYSDIIFDENMKIRILAEELEDGSVAYYAYDAYFTFNPTIQQTRTTTYPLFKRVDFSDTTETFPLQFDKSNTKLYWMDNGDGNDDLGSLYVIDYATKNKSLIYKTDKESIESVFFHPTELIPLFIMLNYDKPKRVILRKATEYQIQDIITKLSEVEHGRPKKWNDMNVADTSLDLNYWLIAPESDQQPHHYFFYNNTDKSIKFLFSMNKILDQYTYAPMHPMTVPVADNLTELCYMTLPTEFDPTIGGQPKRPIPFVVLVHGGPWSRDTWGFDTLVQYLVNRGYGTLQCNFRSSTGLGRRIFIAGVGEWARKMRTDLIDAVNWIVKRNIARKDKVAIFGASYGGYATLAALTMSPDFYACGVDIVGPSSIATLLHSIPPYWKPEYNSMVRKIGGNDSTAAGRKFLDSISPLGFARNIKKPLLIAQGLNDPRVNVNESRQITNALIEARVPFTYMMFPNEGHGFIRPENILAFYAEAEQFLARCLNGKAEPITNEFNESLVEIERFTG